MLNKALLLSLLICNFVLLGSFFSQKNRIKYLQNQNAEILLNNQNGKKFVHNYFNNLGFSVNRFIGSEAQKKISQKLIVNNLCIRISSKQCSSCVYSLLKNLKDKYKKSDISQMQIIIDNRYKYLKNDLCDIGFKKKNILNIEKMFIPHEKSTKPYLFVLQQDFTPTDFHNVDVHCFTYTNRYIEKILERNNTHYQSDSKEMTRTL